MLSLRRSFSLVVILIILLAILGITNPYGNESSRSFYFGLSENLIAAYATDPDVIQATPLEKWEWQTGVVVAPAADLDAAWAR